MRLIKTDKAKSFFHAEYIIVCGYSDTPGTTVRDQLWLTLVKACKAISMVLAMAVVLRIYTNVSTGDQYSDISKLCRFASLLASARAANGCGSCDASRASCS